MGQEVIHLVTTHDQLAALLAAVIGPVRGEGMPPEVVELEKLKRKETLTTEEVEKLFGLNASTLRKRRVHGEGPAYIKDGDKVLYRPDAVRKYLDARRQKTYDQP